MPQSKCNRRTPVLFEGYSTGSTRATIQIALGNTASTIIGGRTFSGIHISNRPLLFIEAASIYQDAITLYVRRLKRGDFD
jgi:hypothetical protein